MKKFPRYILVFICLCVLPCLRKESPGELKFGPVPAQNLHNSVLQSSESGDYHYAISDLTYEKTDRFTHELVFSFNSPVSSVRTDDTGKYRVLKSDYVFVPDRGALGGGCAEFYKKDHVVQIDPGERLWLSSIEDLGSFTIELKLYPNYLKDEGILFSRVGVFSGKKHGIEIAVKNNRIEARFFNLFSMPDGRRRSVILSRGSIIHNKEWAHYSVSFNRKNGALASYLNGKEEEVIYITSSGESSGTIFIPSFGIRENGKWKSPDLPTVKIGKNFTGCIDELRISCREYRDLEKGFELSKQKFRGVQNAGRLPCNVEGVIVSPVYRFKDTGTKVTLFDWDERVRENSFVWMEFRISDNLFYEDDVEIKWYRIKNRQKGIYLQKDKKGNYLRGKYFQWRAHLVPSPDGENSPVISNIRLLFMKDRAPEVPSFVEILEAGDGFVKIRWKKNVDHDLLGYKIYYGYSPEKNDGIISYINGKTISNSLTAGNYIEVVIDNRLIEENRKKDYLKFHDYPLLKNTVLYYFAVSAYDSYRPGSSYNHESAVSKKVSARPYAGSEILTSN